MLCKKLCSFQVYEDAEKIYNRIAKEAEAIIHEAFKVLDPKIIPLPAGETSLRGQIVQKGRLVALNTVHARRREVVPVDMSPDAAVNPLLSRFMKEEAVQVSRDGRTGYVVAENPGAGFSPVAGLFAATAGAEAFQTIDGDFVLRNALIQLTISKGRIVSLYDVKLGRELVPAARTGGLVIFTDRLVLHHSARLWFADSLAAAPLVRPTYWDVCFLFLLLIWRLPR
jgi:alpha-mannosidase